MDRFSLGELTRKDGIKCTKWPSQRLSTIKSVMEKLRKNKLVILRSPPGTGKTSLAYLLVEHLKLEGQVVYSLDFLSLITLGWEKLWKQPLI